jgi:hypothetical protein
VPLSWTVEAGRLGLARHLHHVGTVVGLVRELGGALVVVGGADEPHVRRDRQVAPVDQEARRVGTGSLTRVSRRSSIGLLERGQEVGEELLRAREVDLVEHDQEQPVAAGGRAGPVERLQEVGRVVVAVEGVVVADEVLTVAPAGLHLDDLAAAADGAAKASGRLVLPVPEMPCRSIRRVMARPPRNARTSRSA